MKKSFLVVFVIAILFIVFGCAAKSPLIQASSSGDYLAVQRLINEGANVNEADDKGYTPLMHAAGSGNIETVKILLDKGADIKAKDKYGYTALLWAASYGYSDIVRLLISKGSDVNDIADNNNQLLLQAIQANNTELALLLIDAGVDINVKDANGRDALFHAVEYKNTDIIKKLIKKGANLETQDINGMTPLVLAITQLSEVIGPPMIDIAKKVVKGTEIPAMHPELAKSMDVVRLLIRSGADINAKNTDGETVFDIALCSLQGDIINEIIRKAGVNLWKPEAHKSRLFFIGTGLWDYITLCVGQSSKKLNNNMFVGLVFIDVEPGKHEIAIKVRREKPSVISTIETSAGQTYYIDITQDMKRRVVHYTGIKLSNVAITILAENEGKQKIKEIINIKEIK